MRIADVDPPRLGPRFPQCLRAAQTHPAASVPVRGTTPRKRTGSNGSGSVRSSIPLSPRSTAVNAVSFHSGSPQVQQCVLEQHDAFDGRRRGQHRERPGHT